MVMEPGKNFWLGSGQFFVAPVGPGQPFLVWVWIWKISPKNLNFFIFSLRIKKISLSQVKKYPGLRRVSLLFTAGQKYARVRLGPISRRRPKEF